MLFRSKVSICRSLECLSTNMFTFEICNLDYSSVLKIYEKLNDLSQYYEDKEYSAWELASLSILTLMSKTILLICYRYGLGLSDLVLLKTTDLVIYGDGVELTQGNTKSTRSLKALKREYIKTLTSWHNIRSLEESSDRLFIVFFDYPGLRLGSIDAIDCQIINRYIFFSGDLDAEFIYYFRRL